MCITQASLCFSIKNPPIKTSKVLTLVMRWPLRHKLCDSKHQAKILDTRHIHTLRKRVFCKIWNVVIKRRTQMKPFYLPVKLLLDNWINGITLSSTFIKSKGLCIKAETMLGVELCSKNLVTLLSRLCFFGVTMPTSYRRYIIIPCDLCLFMLCICLHESVFVC